MATSLVRLHIFECSCPHPPPRPGWPPGGPECDRNFSPGPSRHGGEWLPAEASPPQAGRQGRSPTACFADRALAMAGNSLTTKSPKHMSSETVFSPKRHWQAATALGQRDKQLVIQSRARFTSFQLRCAAIPRMRRMSSWGPTKPAARGLAQLARTPGQERHPRAPVPTNRVPPPLDPPCNTAHTGPSTRVRPSP